MSSTSPSKPGDRLIVHIWPSDHDNDWPPLAKAYREKLGNVTKWGAWHFEFKVKVDGFVTYPWHYSRYSTGPAGRGAPSAGLSLACQFEP